MILRPILNAVCRARAGWRTLALSLFVAACGGGVESGGTGGNATASFASGPITGFGSVIVNEVRYDDSGASVTDADGAPRSRDDLKLGMTINLRGTPITTDTGGAQNGTASSIVYASAILGPITTIDPVNATLVVLGQSVDVVATTVFDENLGGALNALTVGDVVEVYGLYDAATQRYRATRIERKSGVAAYRLRGVVADLNTTTRTFTVGTEHITYAALPGGDVPAGLANGSIVRIDLQTSQVGNLRPTLRLRNGVALPQNHDEVRIEGLISAFGSGTNFSVDGVAVDASQASFPDGNPGGVGERVALQGTVDNGVLRATRVQVKSQQQVENDGFDLRGPIVSIDPAARTFVLRGMTVDYSAGPEYKDGNEAALAVAVGVEVRGRLSSDGTRVVATRIVFKR